MDNNYIIVHYGELRLKGRNRKKFEDQLIRNIQNICGGHVVKLGSSLLCIDSNLDKFKYVAGISWYAPCIKIDKRKDYLFNYIYALNNEIFHHKNTFAIKVKRSDKSFPLNSIELSCMLGDIICKRHVIDVDLKNPDLTIYIEINEYILVYYKRYEGIGGFPTGIHGKVLGLLSGGIDSPVAVYSMMRKGCHVDLIHFHVYSNNEEIYKSKIIRLVKKLSNYQFKTKLYLIPSYIFDFTIINNSNIKGYEMILFRRFIHKIAEILSEREGYKAVVNGDSLGQVASQTIENIKAVDSVVNNLIFRPLLAMDKQEIIDLARKINTYEVSIEKYKDCCSIISSKSQTRSDMDKICKYETEIQINNIINSSINLIDDVVV